jgi:hypothetical protein
MKKSKRHTVSLLDAIAAGFVIGTCFTIYALKSFVDSRKREKK